MKENNWELLAISGKIEAEISELDDEDKKKFFNEIDKEWKGDNEKD